MEWQSTYSGVVHAWMCDHFGHVNVRWYAHLFDDAGFVLWTKVGITRDHFGGTHTVVARTETNFRKELLAGQLVGVRSRFVRLGAKSIGYEQELFDLETQQVHAVQSAVEVFFDPETRASREIPAAIRDALSDLVG